MRYGAFFLVFLALAVTVHAASSFDETCPALVQTALSATESLCSATGRNQACYGNAQIMASARPAAETFHFDAQGDIADVIWIESMRLSAMDLDSGMWGVSLLRLQANLPDTLPGQNVTFLLFGDVEVQNRVPLPDLPTVGVTANQTTRLRVGPAMESPVMGWLEAGATATANGRLSDGSWIRLQAPHGGLSAGWAYAPLVSTDSDADELAVVDPNNTQIPPGPMQVFRLKTGTGNLGCAEMPEDGLLIQTPHGAGRIQFEINDVHVELGSTVFVQSVPGRSLSISTVEGSARVEALGHVQWAYPGMTVEVPMSENLTPLSAPQGGRPYEERLVEPLPYGLLDRPVHVYPPLSEDQIALVQQQTSQDEYVCGRAPLPPCVNNDDQSDAGDDSGSTDTITVEESEDDWHEYSGRGLGHVYSRGQGHTRNPDGPRGNAYGRNGGNNANGLRGGG